ncbi:MAG: helix-turn-helix transcriptional regulator [Ruminococcaceae bacterium]|nr:helix-turn-helix transcriptional regulator [Oscillospiraceae bacterium]
MFNRKKLTDFMKKQGVSASELARRFGVTEGAIRHITTGLKQPSLAMTVDIAKWMGCTVDELCKKEDT